MNISFTSSKTTIVLALAALVLTTLAYSPGMTGGFLFDDYPNIVRNVKISHATLDTESLSAATWSGIAGPLRRPVAMLTFGLNSAVSGMNPFGFKVINLLIHLINGVLVFYFSRKIFQLNNEICGNSQYAKSDLLALLVAVVWLIHPINLSTVLYVVQRMTSLSATFCLLALLSYCAGRSLERVNLKSALLLFVATPMFILLGVLSKENALLVIPLILLVEACFFRFGLIGQYLKAHKYLATFWAVSISASAIALLIIFQADWLTDRYRYQPFTLVERLLSESRVLWYYVSLVVFPRLNEFAVFHDDFAISVSLFDPVSTIASIIGILCAVVCAIWYFLRAPIITFSIAWFLIGHSLESTIVPLDLIYEHRNYLPLIGPLVGIGVLVGSVARSASHNRLLVSISLMIVVVFSMLTFLRAGSWSDPVTLAMVESTNHPASFRSVYSAARVQYGLYLMRGTNEDYKQSLQRLEQSLDLNRDSKLALLALLHLTFQEGVEPKKIWLDELERRFRETTTRIADVSSLGKLAECRADKENCKVPADVLLQLYQAANSNPVMKNAVSAQLQVDFAALQINDYQDHESAISLLNNAIQLVPNNYSYHDMRMKIMALSGDYAAALTAIDATRKVPAWKDRLSTPVDDLLEFEVKVKKAIEKRKANEIEEELD